MNVKLHLYDMPDLQTKIKKNNLLKYCYFEDASITVKSCVITCLSLLKFRFYSYKVKLNS